MNAPSNLFYPYQWDWLNDRSQFKIGLWARQTGKDYTCAAEAVFDSLNTPRNHWLIIACGERQARESLQHAKYWAEFCAHNPRSPQIASVSKTEIIFSNGSRITALPAKPETIRGYSANLILTEFAFHDHPDELWRAVFPILTNPLKAGPCKLRIISTPNGHSNRFHKLWTENWNETNNANAECPEITEIPGGTRSTASHFNSSANSALISSSPIFSCHKIPIHEAVAHGLPINIPLLQSGLGDSEAWAQEYQCEFLDRSSVLLPYDLIATCESSESTETSTPNILSTYSSELFLGIDFARKHDLTVAWMLEKLPASSIPGGTRSTASHFNPSSVSSAPSANSALISSPGTTHVFITREVLILENAPTPDQLEQLIPRINRARRVCLDYTGPGIGLGDLLVRQFGEYKANTSHGRIELCTFTQGLKQELFSHLRAAFERRTLSIPSSSAIREDLHSIQRVVSANGQLSFRAAHTPDGHSDRCTALALALRAAESAPPAACASIVGRRFPHLRR